MLKGFDINFRTENIMKKIPVLIFLLICNYAFAQSFVSQPGKVEFYLLKSTTLSIDSPGVIRRQFDVSPGELQDTAVIKDNEIISYTIRKDHFRLMGNKDTIVERFLFNISDAAANKLKALKPDLCCGIKFAVVVNRKVCFTGYFWNLFSSFACDWITVYPVGNIIDVMGKLPDTFATIPNDPRKDRLLVACLKATNRLIIK